MSKALDSGKAFMEQILAKLPESLRDQAKTALLAPEATDALTAVGDGVLARSDYSRQMDEIRAKEAELKAQEETLTSDWQKLNDWYTPRKAVVDKYSSLDAIDAEIAKARGVPPPAIEPKPAPDGLSKEDLEKVLMERDRGYASVLAMTTTLATKHLRDFNEALDVNELIAYATKNRLPLYAPREDADAYRALHGEKLTAKAKADEDARIQKLVDEKYAAKVKDTAQPFPLRNASPSVLDVLTQPADERSKQFSVDAAVAEYERLQSARG